MCLINRWMTINVFPYAQWPTVVLKKMAQFIVINSLSSFNINLLGSNWYNWASRHQIQQAEIYGLKWRCSWSWYETGLHHSHSGNTGQDKVVKLPSLFLLLRISGAWSEYLYIWGEWFTYFQSYGTSYCDAWRSHFHVFSIYFWSHHCHF